MHRVSQEAVKANLSRMYRSMAQRLCGHAKADKPIAVVVQPSFAGNGMLLIADVGENIADRCSFLLKVEDVDLAERIATATRGNANSQKLARKALSALCDRYM